MSKQQESESYPEQRKNLKRVSNTNTEGVVVRPFDDPGPAEWVHVADEEALIDPPA